MLRRVPTPFGEVQAAGKRHAVVDDDDFRMMGRADRMVAIEVKMNAGMTMPTWAKKRGGLPIERVDQSEVPYKHVNVECRPS